MVPCLGIPAEADAEDVFRPPELNRIKDGQDP